MQVATLEWKSRNQRTINGSPSQKQVAIQRVRADSAMVSTLQYCSLVATIKTSSKVDGKHKVSRGYPIVSTCNILLHSKCLDLHHLHQPTRESGDEMNSSVPPGDLEHVNLCSTDMQ